MLNQLSSGWLGGGRCWAALAVPVTILVSPFAAAQQTVEGKVVEASLFKNGLGFLVREVNVPGPGEFVLRNLPVPVHGSFWILPEAKATTVQEAVAFSAPQSEMEEAVTFLELLQANVGKKVEIRTEEGWVAGTVAAVPERHPELPVSLADAASRAGYYSYWSPARAYRPPTAEAGRSPAAAGVVVLRTAEGMLALPPAEIKGLRSADPDLALHFSRSRPGAALRLKVTGEGGRLRVAYLEWGLTWAPSYQVDLSDPQEASIHLKAEVINDVEDLEGATVHFVTGYPNLAFAEAVDPLALLGDVSDFLQSLMDLSAPRRRDHTPVVAQQAVMSNVFRGEAGEVRPAIPGEGEVREDLFLYPQPDVTLQRGERGYYPLFAKRVPYDGVFLWELEDSLDAQSQWRYAWWYGQGNQPGEEQEEVWHSLRLTNAGGIPWTTAPAMTVQEGRVLGQDILFYTPSGGKTLLKITRAVDVKAEQSEIEEERQRNARTAYGGNREFDLVTIRGELRVFNYKNKPITMLVKKTLSGGVEETTPPAVIETTAQGVWRVNAQQLLTWELPVPAGGDLRLSYRYKVFAAR